MQIHFREVISGSGHIDYRTFLKHIASSSRPIPLMLEHLKSAEEYDEGREYIKRIGLTTGIQFA
jgi:hypothetical protein